MLLGMMSIVEDLEKCFGTSVAKDSTWFYVTIRIGLAHRKNILMYKLIHPSIDIVLHWIKIRGVSP
jgi:hypothetical protein